MRRKFWMVWGSGQQAPTYQHESLASAILEAERLARTLMPNTFIVLEAVAAVMKSDVAWERYEEDDDQLTSGEVPF